MSASVPSILVGISTLNGPDRLSRSLESIRAYAPGSRLPFRLLVCDDGSRPEELKENKDAIHRNEWLRAHSNLEMLMNEARLGIPKTWNRLVRHERADVHVILNDDVEVVEHWLDVLSYSVWQNPLVGMVGLNSTREMTSSPRLDFCEAVLTDGCGSLLSSTGYAFAFRREVYDLVGGFDERYFCFYEEVDFGASLRERGYGSYMASYPIVKHAVGQTNGDPRNLDAETCLLESRQKFREKWGGKPAELRDRWPRALVPTSFWNTGLAALVE